MFKFIRLPLSGIGSFVVELNSTSLLSEYKFVISAVHFNVSPPVVDDDTPWKWLFCSGILRLICVLTKFSAVDIYCCSAEYCCNEKKPSQYYLFLFKYGK